VNRAMHSQWGRVEHPGVFTARLCTFVTNKRRMENPDSESTAARVLLQTRRRGARRESCARTATHKHDGPA
jgi:hypothetical protein